MTGLLLTPSGGGVIAADAPTYNVDHNESLPSISSSTVTWTGVTVDGPDIVVFIHWEYSSILSGLITGCTIDGNAMTLVDEIESGSSNDMGVAMYTYTGDFTSVDVVATFNRTMIGAHMCAISISGLSNFPTTVVDDEWEGSASSLALTALGDGTDDPVLSHAASIAFICNSNVDTSGGDSYAGFTELYDTLVESDFRVIAGVKIGTFTEALVQSGAGTHYRMAVGAIFD